MKRFPALMAVILTVLMACALFFAGCSGSSDDHAAPTPTATGDSTISGTVTDESGVPLKGASVTLVQVNRSQQEKNGNILTDENGSFIFENLANGVSYLVRISYDGRITAVIIVEINENDPNPDFKLFLPQGSGTVTFDLPRPAILKDPVVKARQVELEWNMSRNTAMQFDANYLYRKATSNVTPDNTLVFETGTVVNLNYTDNITSEGRWHYRLFSAYKVQDTNVKVLMGSNEVEAYVDKYVFSQRWDEENIPVANPTEIPLEPEQRLEEQGYTMPYDCVVYESGGDRTVYFSDVEQGYIFKMVNDGEIVPFYPAEHPPIEYDTREFSPEGPFFASGLAVDNSGNIYAMDQGQAVIYVFAPDGTHIASSGSFETWMRDITVYDNGTTRIVYATSAVEGLVFKTTFDGVEFTYPTLFKEYQFVEGYDYIEWPFVLGVDVDSSGNVYVSDSIARIYFGQFNIDSIMDKTFEEAVRFLPEQTQFTGHVKKYSSGGALLATITTSGQAFGELFYPASITVDEYDFLYVGDTNQNDGWLLPDTTDARARVMKFDPDGAFVTQFGQYGAPGDYYGGYPAGASSRRAGEGEFTTPRGIAVDSEKSAYVTDPFGMSLQKFVLDLESDE